MSKCTICNSKIPELFLGKIKGTVIKKVGEGKKYFVCFECQKKFPSKKELVEQLK